MIQDIIPDNINQSINNLSGDRGLTWFWPSRTLTIDGAAEHTGPTRITGASGKIVIPASGTMPYSRAECTAVATQGVDITVDNDAKTLLTATCRVNKYGRGILNVDTTNNLSLYADNGLTNVTGTQLITQGIAESAHVTVDVSNSTSVIYTSVTSNQGDLTIIKSSVVLIGAKTGTVIKGVNIDFGQDRYSLTITGNNNTQSNIVIGGEVTIRSTYNTYNTNIIVPTSSALYIHSTVNCLISTLSGQGNIGIPFGVSGPLWVNNWDNWDYNLTSVGTEYPLIGKTGPGKLTINKNVEVIVDRSCSLSIVNSRVRLGVRENQSIDVNSTGISSIWMSSRISGLPANKDQMPTYNTVAFADPVPMSINIDDGQLLIQSAGAARSVAISSSNGNGTLILIGNSYGTIRNPRLELRNYTFSSGPILTDDAADTNTVFQNVNIGQPQMAGTMLQTVTWDLMSSVNDYDLTIRSTDALPLNCLNMIIPQTEQSRLLKTQIANGIADGVYHVVAGTINKLPSGEYCLPIDRRIGSVQSGQKYWTWSASDEGLFVTVGTRP